MTVSGSTSSSSSSSYLHLAPVPGMPQPGPSSLIVSPAVLLAILDHYLRQPLDLSGKAGEAEEAEEQEEALPAGVFGALLGEVAEDGSIRARNSMALLMDEAGEEVGLLCCTPAAAAAAAAAVAVDV